MSSFVRAVQPHIEDFVQHYRDRGQKRESLNHNSQIKYFLRFMSSQRKYIDHVSEIGRKDIELYVEYLWNIDYGAASGAQLNRNNFVYRQLRTLHKFFEHLTIQEDKIEDKLLPQPDLIRKADFPSPHRKGTKHFPRWFDKFIHEKIRSLPEDTIDLLLFKTMMFVLYYMGARIKDVCTLERNCLIEKCGVPWVRVFSNKTKFYYEVPIASELKKYLDKYLEISKGMVRQHPTTHRDVNFMFWVGHSRQFHVFLRDMAKMVKTFSEAVRVQAEEAGLPVKDIHTLALTSHKFRHTVAIRLIRMGADPMLVAEFLGHSDLSMAQSYIQESQQEIDELMEELWDDDVLGLTEELVDGFSFSHDELDSFSGVISRVEGGHCAHVGGKPPCGEDAYDCWLCEKLEPDFDDSGYLERLNGHLVDHQGLRERNVRLGHLGAAKMEEEIVQRIQGFMGAVRMKGICCDG